MILSRIKQYTSNSDSKAVDYVINHREAMNAVR